MSTEHKWSRLTPDCPLYKRLAMVLNDGAITGREVYCPTCNFIFLDDAATECPTCGTELLEQEIKIEYKNGHRL